MDTPATPLDTRATERVSPDTTPQGDTPVSPPHGSPPTLSQAEAAKACNVSTATIRRARDAGRIEAERDAEGGWRIPVPSLVAAGLLDRTTPPDTRATERVSPDTTPQGDTPATPPQHAAELAELRARLAEAEKRAAVAEAVAQERGNALADVRLSLRALTQGPAADARQPAAEPSAAQQQPATPTPAPNPPGERIRNRLHRWRSSHR